MVIHPLFISLNPHLTAGCCRHAEPDRFAAGSGHRSTAWRGDEHHFFCGLPGVGVGGSESWSLSPGFVCDPRWKWMITPLTKPLWASGMILQVGWGRSFHAMWFWSTIQDLQRCPLRMVNVLRPSGRLLHALGYLGFDLQQPAENPRPGFVRA